MATRGLRTRSPQLIMGLGALLFLVAVAHHWTEIADLNGLVGPLLALLLDGLPALGLVYAGHWLSRTDLSPANRWRIFGWCLAGAILFGVVMGLSMLVRLFEGRVVSEAVFPLLIAVEAGSLAGVIAGYHTARARAETRRARTVSEALGFVNSLIRHDLRNDLNVIQGHAELMDGDGGSDAADTDSPAVIAEKADEALTRIDTTGAVANTLIGEPDLEPVDLAGIATEMTTRMANTYNLTVTTDLPDQAWVTANSGLRSVVDNLLENAVEHNDADDPEIHVAVTREDEVVHLAVADNGPGISGEQKERLLDPATGGADGGGLSLVTTLVDGYGGQVWIEDNEPRGAVVNVELPRADS